jgi:hypothetical protein
MADLKPVGSEKLSSDEKLKRILELTYYKQGNNKPSNDAEYIKESKNGGVYAIVKEKGSYYVKRGLNENTLDYIGGLFMKNKNRFSSYGEALKRLEYIKGQEEMELNEATKYVLKTKQKTNEVPLPDPTMDQPVPEPSLGDVPPVDGSETPSMDDPSADPSMSTDASAEGGEQKRSDYMAEIQKYAGKLGQELRDQKERMESDDIKYVLNMIISAVDLDKLDPEDLEEIADKFDMGEDEEEGSMDDVPSPDASSEEPSGEEEEDLGEVSTPMSDLEEFIDEPMDIDMDEIDFGKYAIGEESEEEDDTVELDLDEIKNEINNNINQTLSKYFRQ